MHLTYIRANGLKSGSFTHNLDRVNLITGPSASGKTSILDAVRLALNGGTLLGRKGELKVATSAIMGLSSGNFVEVLASIGSKVTHKQWKKGKPLNIVLDDIPACPDVLMDPGEYMEATASGKIDYAFRLYQLPEDGEFAGPAICAAIKNIRLEENTKETEAILTELYLLADTSDTERHYNGESIQSWLAALIEKFKERLKLAKATAVRMQKTVAGITQLAGDQVQAINPAAEMADERAKLAPIQAEIAKLQSSLDLLEALKQRRTVVAANLQLTNEQGKELDTLKATMDALAQTVEALEAAPVKWAGKAELPELEAQLTKLHDELEGWKPLSSAWVAAENARNSLVREERLNADLKRELETIKKQFEGIGKECCPACGALPADWKGDHSVEELQVKAAAVRGTKATEIALSDRQIGRLKAALLKAEELYSQESAQNATMEAKRQEANRLQLAWDRIQKAKADAYQSAVQKTNAARAQHREAVRAHDALMGKLEGRPQLIGQLAELDGQIATINREQIAAQLANERAALQSVQESIARMEARQRNYIAAQADEKRNAQALLEAAKAQADVDCTNAAVDVLEDIQCKMIKTAFGPIMETVNAVTAGVIPERIEYRDGEIGRFKGSRWITHETFSGTEKALVYAGISLALAKDSPIKIVMIDEMGRMDTGAIATVLQTMKRLADTGTIDQFIGCYSGEFPAVEGVNIIAVK